MTQEELVSSVVELVERAKREEREACARLVDAANLSLYGDRDAARSLVLDMVAKKIRER